MIQAKANGNRCLSKQACDLCDLCDQPPNHPGDEKNENNKKLMTGSHMSRSHRSHRSPKSRIVLEHSNNQEAWAACLDLLLSHFEPPIWPRKISTALYNGGQVLAHDKEQALAWFKAAKYTDCRINAYSALYAERSGPNRQVPDFIFVDIDRKHFKSYKDPQKAFNLAVNKTLKNFKERLPGSCPTVLDTGGGYHFYQPILAPFLLESIPEFTKLSREPSREFLKFAEQILSNGKADPHHTPTFRSSLIRVPGSINSIRSKTVTIVQRWNGHRPAINYLLNDFRKYLIQKDIDQYHNKQRKIDQRLKLNTGYNHNGDDNNNSNSTINWIELYILQGHGISDYRKVTMDLVLAKYLINVKKYSYDTAYNTIVEWLENKCAAKRPLDFNVNYKVNNALRQAIDGPVPLPMRQDTMKEKYPAMYAEIFNGGFQNN